MKLRNLLVGLSALIITLSSCSSARTHTAAADEAFQRANYYNASILYKKAYAKEKNSVAIGEISFKLGECNRLMNDTKEAENWYGKAVDARYSDPVAVLRYADMLKANGKYAEAITQYNLYKRDGGTDKRADIGIKSSEQAQKWIDKPTRARVHNVGDLNTKFMDFAPSYMGTNYNTLIFTSGREESMGTKRDGWTGEKFSDLYLASKDQNGKWSIPKPLAAPINTEVNDGAATYDMTGNTMIFTRCAVEKNKEGVCKLYISSKTGEAWSEPQLLPFNSDTFTVGHPSLTADGNTLYFSSNMPGGLGGKDIWVSKYDQSTNTWGQPSNMGSLVNTEMDEMYPFIRDNGNLYFSSNGHAGMGGLDIFVSKFEGGKFAAPTNMMSPTNSPADDFGIIYEKGKESGYLTSTREGGKGEDDIYSHELIELTFTVSGRVYDIDTKESLKDAKVELFGSDGRYNSVITETDGTYKYSLSENTSYTISATVLGYLNKKLQVSTVGLEESRDFIGDFDFALHSISRPIELPEIYYDLDKATLRPESKKELDGLIVTLGDNPNVTVRINSHTDSRATDAYNIDLSNRRAKSVVDYLIANGIPSDRLSSKGFGESKLKIPDSEIDKLKTDAEKEAAHQQNRRTEFEVLRTDYVPKKK